MTQLTNAELETLRTRPQSTNLYLSVFQPQIVFQARVNNPSIDVGARTIAYDSVSLGAYTSIHANSTMWVGTTPGAKDVGKIRVRFADASYIYVSENENIDWADNLYLTVFYYIELWPIFPRIITDPSDDENVIFYKDYDVPYTNQNSILGTYINMGPHRAGFVNEPVYYTATGTHNLVGASISYHWVFEGGSPSTSTSAVPGYVTYGTPGNYVTRLIVSGSNGSADMSYRYVSMYDRPGAGSTPPIIRWEMTQFSGSRDEGGYKASFKVYDDVDLDDNYVVVLFAEDWYGTTKQSFGGNYPNASNILFVGHILEDSIHYDYQDSFVEFSVGSLTQLMKDALGFSVSVESVASPDVWYELLDMDCRRAIYHYLRWHTTAMSIGDFKFVGTDQKIQFFDADRTSMYDAIDNLLRNTLIGKAVSDRQGKTWMEIDAKAYSSPTASFPSIMDITNRDWMNQPTIEERLSDDVSYLEYGGIAYSGVSTGTFSAILAAAPGNVPSFRGTIETHEGLALSDQTQLNRMVGNVWANENSKYPKIDMEMAINARNLDIAPQETVTVNVLATDTVRGEAVQGRYIPDGMDWRYDGKNLILLPSVRFRNLVDGVPGQTITVSSDIGGGFNVPGLQIPPLPPITFPPFALTNTGSSCCDYLNDLGLALGPFCCVVMSDRQLVAGCENVQREQFPLTITYASNMQMYDPVTQRINFINTGSMTFDFTLFSVYNVTEGHCGSTLWPVLYDGNTNTPIIDGPGAHYPLFQEGIFVAGAMDFQTCVFHTVGGEPSVTVPPAVTVRMFRSEFKAPNYIRLFVDNGLCGENSTENCNACDDLAQMGWVQTRFSVCAVTS